MKAQDKVKMYRDIERHGQMIIDYFRPVETDPIKICKRLLRLERKAHHATTCLCNTNTLNLLELNKHTGYDVQQATEEEQEAFFAGIEKSLEKILGKLCMNICFINHDPRGYALKIMPEMTPNGFYKDWGGNGIIAPDFTPDT